jgi:Fe-S cluster biogenesis protein NfuA
MIVIGRKKVRRKALVEQTIATVLAEVGPLLRIEHCRMEVADYSEATGVLMLRVDASCPDCGLSPATFMPAIEAHLRLRVPEVREVRMMGD